jgi:hypothetical protein
MNCNKSAKYFAFKMNTIERKSKNSAKIHMVDASFEIDSTLV